MSEKIYPCKFHHVYKTTGGCKRSAEDCFQSHSNEPGDGPCQEPYCVANGKQFTHMAKNHGKKPIASASPSPQKDPKTILLEKIYDKLAKKLSGKITGMFAEAFDVIELQKILDDPKEFEEHVKLACETLNEHYK